MDRLVESPRAPAWWELLLLLAPVLALRLVHLDFAPHFDELYHVLAGRSWLDEGDFCIADCLRPYGRGALFTILAAGSIAVTGIEDLVAARLPSVIAGTFTVLLIFLWAYRHVGDAAAWASALLFAVVPISIYVSQFARFYALHALLFWMGALSFYVLATGGTRKWQAALLGTIAVIALFVAFRLQVMTLIGLAALAAWAAADPLPEFVRRHRRERWLPWAGAAVLILGVVALFVAVQSGLLQSYWRTYRWAQLWSLDVRDDVLFYHRWMYAEYGPLYAFLPAAAVIATARAARPALFCAVIFVVAFVAHSFGGFKGFRLVYWVMPAFFVLWGIAVSAVAPALARAGERAAERVSGGRLRERWRAWAGLAAAAAAALFVVGNTDAFNTTLKLMTLTDDEWPGSKPWYRGNSNWPAALEELRPRAETAEVVLTSSSPKALYYLGRSDASISANQLFRPDNEMEPEFSLDPRLGYPVISRPASVERVMDCYSSGLIVVELGHWATPGAVPPETALFLEETAREIPLPRRWRLRAFEWEHPPAASTSTTGGGAETAGERTIAEAGEGGPEGETPSARPRCHPPPLEPAAGRRAGASPDAPGG